MGASNWVYLDCALLRCSDKAVHIETEDGQLWIPLSQIGPGEEEKVRKLLLNRNDLKPVKGVTLQITEWIADQKGIDHD